jgi:hypothetical protein
MGMKELKIIFLRDDQSVLRSLKEILARYQSHFIRKNYAGSEYERFL